MAANRKPSLFKPAKVGFVFNSAARNDNNRKEYLQSRRSIPYFPTNLEIQLNTASLDPGLIPPSLLAPVDGVPFVYRLFCVSSL